MLKRLISAAAALTMALTLTASLLGADAGTGVVESTETVTGSFSCSFVDNDYDTNLTGVSGIGTKNTWGMDFPVITELELPSSVKTLNYRVLANCTGLTKLVVPASVTSINENAFDFTTGVTLHVYSGSYALDWAKSHSVSYYLIDPLAGDSNRDGVVDSSELERILMHILGLSLISQPDGDPADGNRDVSIDIRDFNLAYYEMTR